MKRAKIVFLVMLVTVLVMALVMGGCGQSKTGGGGSGGDKATVGIAMPSKELPIFYAYGQVIQKTLQEAGYETVLEYAEDAPERQVAQIENMILKGVDYLVISAVDTSALSDVCERAQAEGIKVIAGDRLIMNTMAVDHYVTFDLVRLGELEGEGIENGLGLKEGNKGPFTMEIFSGGPDDSNAILFYEGQMNILQKYMDDGTLVVKSGQTDFSTTGILGWDSAKAQSRMDNLLGAHYADTKLDAVLSAADCLSLGVISSLENFGYTAGPDWPVITGADCEITAIDFIINGKQYMSVFVDPIPFAGRILLVIDAFEAGGDVPYNTTYFNDMFEVPTTLYDSTVIDITNYMTLVDVGFYSEADIASLK